MVVFPFVLDSPGSSEHIKRRDQLCNVPVSHKTTSTKTTSAAGDQLAYP
jgi:hypothetical protein